MLIMLLHTFIMYILSLLILPGKEEENITLNIEENTLNPIFMTDRSNEQNKLFVRSEVYSDHLRSLNSDFETYFKERFPQFSEETISNLRQRFLTFFDDANNIAKSLDPSLQNNAEYIEMCRDCDKFRYNCLTRNDFEKVFGKADLQKKDEVYCEQYANYLDTLHTGEGKGYLFESGLPFIRVLVTTFISNLSYKNNK